MRYFNYKVCVAAACLPSISAAVLTPLLNTAATPQPQRNEPKIVPRFRARSTSAPALLVPLPHEHHTHVIHDHMAHDPTAFAAADVARDGSGPAMSRGGSASILVNRILQVALGLFVTTMELPPLPLESLDRRELGYDCDFATACRWGSVGATSERWRLARGEPDVLLWLAATGTMVLPAEPFTLIEIRGGTPVDMLSSDVIPCQRELASFGFTYWTIGTSDLEICLLDLHYRQFNCTGMLQSHIQPGKVALKIPLVKHPFRIAIIPSMDQGILILDDIQYDAKYCGDSSAVIEPLPAVTSMPDATTWRPATLGLTGPTAFPFIPNPTTTTVLPTTFPQLTFTPVVPPFIMTSTLAPFTVMPTRMASLPNLFTVAPPAPLTMPPPSVPVPMPVVLPFGFTLLTSTIFPLTAPMASTEFPYVTPKPILIVPEPMFPFAVRSTTTTLPEPTPSGNGNESFDLLIYGNRTSPLFDRRRGEIIKDSADLLCDFGNNFPCLWGPNAGKWAVIDKGAIPSLEFGTPSQTQLPAYPAVVVIQGAAMLTSDPLLCQSGEGKLLFRYWTNGRVLMQVCATGHGLDSEKTQCVEEFTKSNEPFNASSGSRSSSMDSSTLAVFTLSNVIHEPFTLNIIPIFERSSHNNFLVLDEIAYIGECNLTMLAEHKQKLPHPSGIFGSSTRAISGSRSLATQKSSSADGSDWSRVDTEDRGDNEDMSSSGGSTEIQVTATTRPQIRIASLTSSPRRSTISSNLLPKINPPVILPVAKIFPDITRKGTRYPFTLTTPFIVPTTISSLHVFTTTAEPRPTTIVFPDRRSPDNTRGSFTIPIPSTLSSNAVATEEPPIDYCKLLNCDFNENACNYLNHGMTKIPWTLKNKGYGFPLSKSTDLKPIPVNGQFVSALLGPGDFAILESPHFNVTQGINVLLFQYYRPTHLSAIRLCLRTRYTKPYRTIASFLQCPPILRSVTSKNALKWNSVHIQLPPGTSHFYLVAHNLERSAEKAAVAIDNIRVAICDPRNYAPPHESELEDLENELNGSNGDEAEESLNESSKTGTTDVQPLYSNN